MIKVKISTSFPELPLLRQTPGGRGEWDGVKFIVNEDEEECDFWVIYEGILKLETCVCPKENTMIILGDPPCFRSYNSEFLSQFSCVVTCDRKLSHPHVIQTQQGMPWHIGLKFDNGKYMSTHKDYDQFKDLINPQKNKLLSVISSNKSFSKGHAQRVKFAHEVKKYFGDDVDLFGRGICEVHDKWDAIGRYKYHIALENSSVKDYWTEKLSDSFLGGAYPFYYGCPNILDYFPKGSHTVIDIHNIGKSIATIKEAIQNGHYEKSLSKIVEAKQLVLEKYNLFPMLVNLFKQKEKSSQKVNVSLKPEIYFNNNFGNNISRVLRIIKKII